MTRRVTEPSPSDPSDLSNPSNPTDPDDTSVSNANTRKQARRRVPRSLPTLSRTLLRPFTDE